MYGMGQILVYNERDDTRDGMAQIQNQRDNKILMYIYNKTDGTRDRTGQQELEIFLTDTLHNMYNIMIMRGTTPVKECDNMYNERSGTSDGMGQ